VSEGKPEDKHDAMERILLHFLPDAHVQSYLKLHAAGWIPRDQAETFLGGPQVLQELTDRGLVHPAPHTPEAPASFRVAPIDLAMMAIVKDLKDQAIRDHQRLIEGYESLNEIRSWPRASRSQCRDHLVRVLSDPEEIMRLSQTMINSARQDWMSLETLDSEMPLTEDFLASAPPVLRDGLRVRAIYDQASIDHPVASANLQRAMTAGEQARVLPALPLKLKMADGTVVMLPLNTTGTGGALLIYAEPIIRGLREYFELLWLRAVPVGSAAPPTGCPLTSEQHDVLRLLVQGLPYKAIEHRLNISERTLNRRVTAIMKELDTHSPFAAGAAAQRRGWIGS
jgi:DNA-binding CsgD family transcriptional regulator